MIKLLNRLAARAVVFVIMGLKLGRKDMQKAGEKRARDKFSKNIQKLAQYG